MDQQSESAHVRLSRTSIEPNSSGFTRKASSIRSSNDDEWKEKYKNAIIKLKEVLTDKDKLINDLRKNCERIQNEVKMERNLFEKVSRKWDEKMTEHTTRLRKMANGENIESDNRSTKSMKNENMNENEWNNQRSGSSRSSLSNKMTKRSTPRSIQSIEKSSVTFEPEISERNAVWDPSGDLCF